MAAKYQHLALTQVQPDMILSDELLDLQGHVLLARGTRLTEAMLASMPGHGIEMLPILMEMAPAESQEEQVSQREQHQKRIAFLFRKNDPDSDSDWATGLLRRYVEDFRLGSE